MRPPGLLVASLIGALLFAHAPPAPGEGLSWVCGHCQLSAGIGETYHLWGRTGGIVVPIAFTWDDDRYEFGAFRFTTRQEVEYDERAPDRRVTRPYWGFSAVRRWELLGPRSARLFIGVGASYKTEVDKLNSTHWNFAPQLGIRFRLNGGAAGLELCLRHFSNAGLRLPNRGEDFLTVTFVF